MRKELYFFQSPIKKERGRGKYLERGSERVREAKECERGERDWQWGEIGLSAGGMFVGKEG